MTKQQKHNSSSQKKKHSIQYSNTDLTDMESQRCDVIDEFVAYERQMTQLEDDIIPALAMRNYHLPGNTYCQDIFQYFQNNHPIISICCHHKHHPIQFRMRILQLFGSIIFGLSITNIIWLYFYFSPSSDPNDPVVTLQFGDKNNTTSTTITDISSQEFEITQGMVFLWTFGSISHAIYDNTIWYISACVCCLSSKRLVWYRKWGTYIVITIIVTFTAIATLALLLRSSAEYIANEKEQQQQQQQLNISDDDTIQIIQFHKDYVIEFLISYVTEFILALFIYYPMIAIILFSGILGCGTIPILGGRPYEVMVAEKNAIAIRRSTPNSIKR